METRTAGRGGFSGGMEELCKTGQLMKALRRVERAVEEGCHIPNKVFYAVLKRCIEEEDLAAGKELHRLTLRCGGDVKLFLESHLIRMFASCGSLSDATRMFETIQKPTAFSWSAIISVHVKFGRNRQAMDLYQRMNCCGIEGDDHTYVAALKACGSGNMFQYGKVVHMDVLCGGFDASLFVGNAVIDMYCKCGSMLDGMRALKSMRKKDTVTWNSMLSGYACHGYSDEALDLFIRMQLDGAKPNVTTWNILISGLAQRGLAHEASMLIRNMKAKGVIPNTATWNVLIGGYAQSGLFDSIVSAYQQMRVEGHNPDHITLLSILRAFKRETLEEEIQARALQPLHLSFSCKSVADRRLLEMARSLFDRQQRWPLEAWNGMITAYAGCGHSFEAFFLFQKMLEQRTPRPDRVTFISTLMACSVASSLDKIMLIHATAVEHELDKDMLVGSSLIDTYSSKYDSLHDARSVFEGMPRRDGVTWTVMIAVYTKHGLHTSALEHVCRMQCESVECNRVTLLFYLKACASIEALEDGLLGHAVAVMNGSQSDSDPYIGTSLIDMYGKCGSLDDACSVFRKLPTRLPATWNAMIAVCAQGGRSWESITLFHQMLQAGLETNRTTYLSILKVCTESTALTQGKLLHAFSIEAGFESNTQVKSALVGMYAKCGSTDDARKVFTDMQERDIVAWNAMITGYAEAGDHGRALHCFEELKRRGEVRADSVTFICLLSLCSHMGLKEKGRLLFLSMMEDRSIAPSSEHYNCMVDLLGNSGLLREAEDCVFSMPPTPNIIGLTSLLNHCGRHIDGDRGQRCFTQF